MFNEQLEREEKEREQIEKRRMEMRHKLKEIPKTTTKKSQLEEKKVNKEQIAQQVNSQKHTQIRKMIEPICKKFHAMFRPSVYDTKMNKYRF